MSKHEDAPRLGFDVSGSRQIRASALGRGTQGVPDVRRMIESQFHIAFPHRTWVTGEVGAAAVGGDGALRFRLNPATGADAFSLPCVLSADSTAAVRELLHRSHDADLEDVVREGRLARVGGLLRFDAGRGSVVLTVSELDPTPTALELADAREQAVRAVESAGLAGRQSTRTPGTAPLELAVVADAGSGAADAVRQQLAASGYAVRARFLEVPLTGADAPAQLAQAVRSAGAGSDVVLLVRDAGRPLALAWYDAQQVAEAVADAPVPVVTGLGGGGIRTATDAVAFAALPTAAAAVQWVLTRIAEAERRLEDLAGDVDAEVDAAGVRARRSLEEVREDVERRLPEAVARAEQARRRARVALLVGCAVLAVLLVVAAVVAEQPLLLVGLVVPGAVLAGVLQWWKRAGTRGSRRMGQRDEDFTAVLDRLRRVRDELGSTSSPERVATLRDQAQELVTQGRTLLGRHLDPPVAVPPAAAAAGAPAGSDAVPAAGPDAGAAAGSDAAGPDEAAARPGGPATQAASVSDGRTEVLRVSPP